MTGKILKALVRVFGFNGTENEKSAGLETTKRIQSLDLARGLIVGIMALDHTRMYFTNAIFDPVDLAHTTPGYFFTRWITHLCAPGFFFIAGIGAALFCDHATSQNRAARYFLSRGVWLMFLEVVVLGLFWSFHVGWWWFGVLWCLGACFVLLSALVYLPRGVAFSFGAIVIIAGPLLAHLSPLAGSAYSQAYTLVYGSGLFETSITGARLVLFPVLPWFGLMALGFGTANFFYKRNGADVPALAIAGIVLLLAFTFLRSGNFYGEPTRQLSSTGAAPIRVFLEFLDVEKYPPSLHYSLLMIGMLLLLIAVLGRYDRETNLPALLKPMNAYGRAPFAFYIVHILLIHGLALIVATLWHWPTAYLFWSGFAPNLQPPSGYGVPLVGVYCIWLVVLAILYPLCIAASRLKQKKSWWWLRYI